jgi:chemotaxis protein methyltransferase CheR
METCMREAGADTLRGYIESLLRDEQALGRLVLALSSVPRSPAKDAEFLAHLREQLLPMLRTWPFIRIWQVGCALGPEAYALCALLEEEGLYDRARVYATDFSEAAVAVAQAGVFPLAALRKWSDLHRAGGGKEPLSAFYGNESGRGTFHDTLRRNLIFTRHHLAADGSFNEFNLILCRHMLPILDAGAQAKAGRLILGSLSRFGYLVLGGRESLPGALSGNLQEIDAKHRIYRRTA